MRLPPAPSKVAPERLFRALAGRDRPSWQLPEWHGVSGLSVCALSGSELDEIIPFGQVLTEVASSESRSTLISTTLVDHTGARVFGSASDVGHMMERDADTLFALVAEALCIISPTYGRSDSAEWRRTLRRGAEHPGNRALCRAAIESFEVVPPSATFLPRPQMFFGKPLADLTDGQWWAFDAAWSTRPR